MDHETADYLCHFGVKGMKWGVRKQEDRVKKPTRRERKEMKRQEKANTKKAFD